MGTAGGRTKAAAAITALACLAGLAGSTGVSAAAGESTSIVAPAEASADTWIDTADRQAVIDHHAAGFTSPDPDMGWTGDPETCDVGTTSAAFRTATIDRVNWFRSMAGLPPVTENAEYSALAQQAVLTTSLSPAGGLTHTPPATYECYTPEAAEVSEHSNLYKARSGPWAIVGYINDWGEGNESAGHRNWLLSPTATQFGTGDSEAVNGVGTASNVLYVVEPREVLDADNPTMREPDGFVAWPNRGFVPADVVFPRWSFSLRAADFSNATVRTQRLDGSTTVEVASPIIFNDSQPGAAPQEILVWEPALDFPDDTFGRSPLPTPAFDQTHRVTIGNVVVDGETRSFTYEVIVLGENPAADVVPIDDPPPLVEVSEPVERPDATINIVDRHVVVERSDLNGRDLGRAIAAGARTASLGRATATLITGLGG